MYAQIPGPAFGYRQVRSGIPSTTPRFRLTSPELANGRPVPQADWGNAFGCTGGDQAPDLYWTGAPAGTRSYAITLFDPDAPTGSGFWHWMAWDLPASAGSFTGTLPSGAVAGVDDAGVTGYLGPCPPAGDRTHHYLMTVLALNVPTLDLPATTSPAFTSFAMSAHVIGYARITATARR